jgi:CRISPR-associated protein Cas2
MSVTVSFSVGEHKRWLIAYDIRDPKRLGRVYRYLSKHAIAVQYSAFVVEGTDTHLHEILWQIGQRIDAHQDDVRAYHVPHNAQVWTLGCQFAMNGCTVTDAVLDTLLHPQSEDEKNHHNTCHLPDRTVII